MRFSVAWAKVAAQNVTLKLATVILSAIVVVQLFVLLDLSLRNPLVVDRSCFSRLALAKPQEPTADEIKGFLLEALPMRFDSSTVVKDGFLSIEETANREKEQVTLKQRQMSQRVLVSDVTVDGKYAVVTADRLISVGKVKSALPFNLKATLQQTNRTESNPYGLIVSQISLIEEKEDKQ
ncbi:MAG: hypothetical protein C5B49_08855 [Bdellovibrio sp.]|nr:MAG: hypothetical protein C5B49_08855 [Bdellovibrio sp.]